MDTSATQAAPSAWRELAATRRLGQFVLLCLGVWLHAADTLMTATVMPAAIERISGLAYVSWTIALYQIGSIVAGAVAVLVVRRHGLRAVLLISVAAYGAGCVASALAPDMGVMLAGRLVQGVGGGMLVAISYIAIPALFAPHLWTRLLAIVSMIWFAGALLGPLVGGLFADGSLWRGAFWAFAVQAAALGVAVWLWLDRTAPDRAPPDPAPMARGPWWPLLLLTLATLMIAQAGVVRDTGAALGLGGGGLALLYAAARLDARAAEPMLPRGLLAIRSRLGAGLLMVFVLSASSCGFWAYGPLLMKILFGTDPLVAGLILAGESVAWSLSTMATSGAAPRWEVPLIRGGCLALALGSAGFVATMPAGWFTGIVLCALVQGMGFGLCWPFLIKRLIAAAPAVQQDLAASAAPNVQRIGYAVGAAATGIAANAAGLAEGATVAAARGAAVWVFAAFIPLLAIGLAAAWRFTAAAERA